MAIPYDNPDSGYAWVILATCFCLHILISSSYATLGLLLVEYIQHFQQDKTVTSWIGAMQLSMCGMMGLFVGPLVQRFGARWMVRVGAALVTGGYVMSALAPSVYFLYFSQGIVTGTGFSCWVVSVNVVVQQWFDQKRGFAMALSTVGLSTGVLTWSYFVRTTIEYYGFRGALFLIAALNMHGFIIAAILRPPRYRPVAENLRDQEDGKVADNDAERSDSACSKDDSYLSSLLSEPVPALNDSGIADDKDGHIRLNDSSKYRIGFNKDNGAMEEVTEKETFDDCLKYENIVNQHVVATCIYGGESPPDSKHIHTAKAFDEVDLKLDAEKDSFSSQDSVFINTATVPKQEVVSRNTDGTKQTNRNGFHGAFTNIFTNILDVSLLKTPAIPLYLVSVFFSNFGHMIPFSFIPIRVVNGGATKEAAALLVTTMGIGSCFGRLFFGWVGDRPWANRRLMFAIANVFVGSISALSYLFSEYRILVGYCVIYAMLSACYVSVQATIIGDIVPRPRLPKAIGLFVMCIGVALLASTSMSGFLIDVWGNPAAPFLVMGCFQVFGGLLALIGYFYGRKQDRAAKEDTGNDGKKDQSC